MGFHLRSWQKICASSTYLNPRWQMNAYEMNDHAIYWTQKVNFNSLIERKGHLARINKPSDLTDGQNTLLRNTTITSSSNLGALLRL